MEYNYKRIFLENRQLTNKTTIIWMTIVACIVGVCWALELLNVVQLSTWIFHIMAPASMILLITPAILNHIFHMSDTSNIDKKSIDRLTILILSCSLGSVFLLSVALSHYITFAWIFPMLIACQYYSRRITKYTFTASVVGILVSFILSLYCGVWDYNMMAAPTLLGVRTISITILGKSVMYMIPKILLYCATFPIFISITKRTELMMKKQKLSLMTHQAKKSFDTLQEFPDTFNTDCRIKLRYLSKNGIDVDTALKNMGGNIDKYNDFMLTFVSESRRKQGELLNLMNSESLLQYGAKIHSLRVKANALGLRNLTDTSFFLEMEAFADNPDVVKANWEKLEFEWNEACDFFTDYIQSLGLKEHATDKNGNQITFKKWGEQLQEAFNALEVYDTEKARNIINELLQYQIDADINKKLESIVANIDEIISMN